MKDFKATLVILFYLVGLHATASHPNSPRAKGFTENKGQISNQHGESNQSIDFHYHFNKNLNVFVEPNTLSFDTYQFDERVVNIHRLDVEFLDANSEPLLIVGDEVSSRERYYADGSLMANDIKSFQSITYQNLYEGVDIKYAIDQNGNVKYDFILNQGACGEEITIRYSGFDSVEIGNTELDFNLSGIHLKDLIPMSWMTSNMEPIDVAYKVESCDENELVVRFEIPNYVSDEHIVIDPVVQLEWGTYYGGELEDEGRAVSVDSLGNLFVTGKTYSTTFIASEEGHQSTMSNELSDAFVLKMNQHGLRHWATYYGGSGEDVGLDIDVSAHNQIYVVGETYSTDSIGGEGAHQAAQGGLSDGFVAMFDRYGQLVWDTFVGGPGDDKATACHSDSLGNVMVVGITNAGQFLENDSITPIQGYQGGIDGFLAHFSKEGVLQKSSFIGSTGDDSITGVSSAASSTYITGSTNSTFGLGIGNALQFEHGGETDAFIMKLDTSMMITWSTYFGAENLDVAKGIESLNDTVYIVGETTSILAYSDTLTYQDSLAGGQDGFILSLLPDGGFHWFTYIGDSNTEVMAGIATDPSGGIYVGGTTVSDSALAVLADTSYIPEDLHMAYGPGGQDAFITKFTRHGERLWGTYHGASGEDRMMHLDVYGVTSIYVVGVTNSTDSIAKSSIQQPAHQMSIASDSSDSFLARFTQVESTSCVGISPVGSGGPGGPGGYGGPGGGSGGGGGPQPIGICIGDSLLLGVSGGALGLNAEWVWYLDSCGGTDNFFDEGSQVWVSPDTTTTYYVRGESVDSQCGCKSVKVHVDYPNTAEAWAEDSICPGTTLNLHSAGGFYYQWTGPLEYLSYEQNPAIDTVPAGAEGLYELIAYTQFGCSDTTEVEVELLPPAIFSVAETPIYCHNDSTGSISVASEDSLMTFEWVGIETDSMTITDLGPGTYTVVGTNAHGCSASQSIVFTNPPEIIDSVDVIPAWCDKPNGGVSIFVTQAPSSMTYVWNPADYSGAGSLALLPGPYHVTVIDSMGCVDSVAFTVPNLGEFTAVIPTDSIFLEFQATDDVFAYPTPDVDDPTYTWWPEAGLSCPDCSETMVDPDSTTTYYVMIESAQGCQSIDSVYVKRELPLPDAFVPTIFSPNGDGLNDQLCVDGVRMVSFDLKVFADDGNLVFESRTNDDCWDGQINGVPQTGSYMYVFEAVLEENMTHKESGYITIRR